MRARVLIGVAAAVAASALTATAPAQTDMQLACVKGKNTTLTNVPSTVSHLRFRFWTARGKSWTGPWLYPGNHDSVFEPTHAGAVRVMALVHFKSQANPHGDGSITSIKARCS